MILVMEETDKTPLMLRFLFGEKVETASQKRLAVTLKKERGDSERTMQWCGWFEEWMEERGGK